MFVPSYIFKTSNCASTALKGNFLRIKKGATRSTGLLEIIHTNICGPFPVPSVDCFDSFITFIDDFSCY